MKQHSLRYSPSAVALPWGTVVCGALLGGSLLGCNAARVEPAPDAAASAPPMRVGGKERQAAPSKASRDGGAGLSPREAGTSPDATDALDAGGPTPSADGAPEPLDVPEPLPPTPDASAPVDASVPPPVEPPPPVDPPPLVDPPPPEGTPFPSDQQVPVVFTDVGPAAGIAPYVMATGPRAGVAAEDYDGDGFIDLFVPTGEGVPNHLYRNQGDGTFVDVAREVGLDSTLKHRTALWFDADGDEDLDLVIASDCRDLRPTDGLPCPVFENLWLYEQGADGTFSDVSVAAGLDVAWGGFPNQHRAGMAAGDIDGDGDLDLVVPGWQMRPFLFENDGNGGFTDITEAAGISLDPLFYQRAVFHDFDRDGHLDLYFAIDIYAPNTLYRNQGDGTFVDVAELAGVHNASTDMGVTIGDYDNDGDFDFYVTVITQDQFANKLYRNDSDAESLRYTDVAPELGVASAGWGWGTTFFDADNDGWLDLATTNGSAQGSRFIRDVSRFWLNPGAGGGPFLDATFPARFNDTDVASGLVACDYDRDGDLDLIQAVNGGGPLRLLQNERQGAATENHYLVIRPRQPGTPNAWAIGATVTARAGDLTLMRPIHAGISTDSQEPAEAFFGLGTATLVDEVTVTWPNGEVTVLEAVASDQVLTVTP